MAAQLYKTQSGRLFHAGSIAIIMIGLPARGKTHISCSLARYLNWIGVKTEAFHVGDYRRKILGTKNSEFFDPGNQESSKIREKILYLVVDDILKWYKSGGQIGILDASNTIRDNRLDIYHQLTGHGVSVRLLFNFKESVCDNKEIIEANIRSVKISSPDYVEWSPDKAVIDFQQRINQHMKYYQGIDERDADLSYIKILNLTQLVINNIKGYLQNGESTNDISFTQDPGLTEQGRTYATNLKHTIIKRREESFENSNKPNRNLKIWTSTYKRSIETGYLFIQDFEDKEKLVSDEPHALSSSGSVILEPRKALVQIHPGVCEGLTEEELRTKYPVEFETKKKNPYRHRYPRAESYFDLAVRLESVILELEREKDDVVIIAHESVLQCLSAYFFNIPESEIPNAKYPPGFVVEITPSAYTFKETKIPIIP